MGEHCALVTPPAQHPGIHTVASPKLELVTLLTKAGSYTQDTQADRQTDAAAAAEAASVL